MARSSLLDAAIAALQRRFGPHAARWGSALDPPGSSHLPTGLPELDAALGGGLPRSAATLLIGSPTAGTTTAALRCCAATQQRREVAVYLDTSATFDPVYAQACGVDLDQLLLVRPQATLETLEIVAALIDSGGVGVLVLDAVPRLPEETGSTLLRTALRQIEHALRRAPTALVINHSLPGSRPLAPPPTIGLSTLATLRLTFARERWLDQDGAIAGCLARVHVQQRPFAGGGAVARVVIPYGDTGSAPV
jgi:recombination protein RecA